MARRRRFAFAAPVVVIAGCHRPIADAPPPPPPPRSPDAHVAAAPVDAGRDAFEMTDDELRKFCARPENRCNPPPPRLVPPDAPPPPLRGSVVAARAADSPTAQRRSIVTVAIGQRDGVQPAWRGELIRGERRIGTFLIVSVAERTTTGFSDLPASQIDRSAAVRFTPP
jgi:hypothetical protein